MRDVHICNSSYGQFVEMQERIEELEKRLAIAESWILGYCSPEICAAYREERGGEG